MKDAYVDKNTTVQDIRFSGSLSVPYIESGGSKAYVSYAVDPSKVLTAGGDFRSKDAIEKDDSIGNCIIDFGFVYTQDSYMGYNPNNLTLENADASVYYQRMSVVKNNANKKAAFDGDNWSGVTYHPYDATLDTDTSLTFNLVITMKAKNWKKLYAARPYIVYKYNGILYTVYDNGVSAGGEESYEEEPAPIVYSNGTVFSTALSYGLDFYGVDPLPADAAKVDNYLRTRIFAHQADFGKDDVAPAVAEAAGINWWKTDHVTDHAMIPCLIMH